MRTEDLNQGYEKVRVAPEHGLTQTFRVAFQMGGSVTRPFTAQNREPAQPRVRKWVQNSSEQLRYSYLGTVSQRGLAIFPVHPMSLPRKCPDRKGLFEFEPGPGRPHNIFKNWARDGKPTLRSLRIVRYGAESPLNRKY
jgi:hypothetical protein